MRALGGAIGHDQRWLAASARPAATLGEVIRRRRRHVPEIHGVELGDVDTEFHRRRADKYRQESFSVGDLLKLRLKILLFQLLPVRLPPTEAGFADLPRLGLNLRGVFPRLEAEYGAATVIIIPESAR